MAVRLPPDDDDDTFVDDSGIKHDVEITFDTIAGRLNEYIETEGVDPEVHLFYSNILRTNTLFPIQIAYLAAAYQVAMGEAYVFRRQHQREVLAKSRKFNGVVKM
jgi:hypothetical protein